MPKIVIGHRDSILHAEERGIVYEDGKSTLEETWDLLSGIYKNDAEKQHEEELKDLEVTNFVNLSWGEMKIFHDLAGLEGLRRINCTENTENEPLLLRRKCVKDIVSILSNNIETLKRAIQVETETKTAFPFYRGLETREEKRSEIECCIKFENLVFRGAFSRRWERPDAMYRQLVRKNVIGDISIEIKRGEICCTATEKEEEQNFEICEYVIMSLERGLETCDILLDIQRYISFYILKSVFNIPSVISRRTVFYGTKNSEIVEIKILWDGTLCFILNGACCTYQNCLASGIAK